MLLCCFAPTSAAGDGPADWAPEANSAGTVDSARSSTNILPAASGDSGGNNGVVASSSSLMLAQSEDTAVAPGSAVQTAAGVPRFPAHHVITYAAGACGVQGGLRPAVPGPYAKASAPPATTIMKTSRSCADIAGGMGGGNDNRAPAISPARQQLWSPPPTLPGKPATPRTGAPQPTLSQVLQASMSDSLSLRNTLSFMGTIKAARGAVGVSGIAGTPEDVSAGRFAAEYLRRLSRLVPATPLLRGSDAGACDEDTPPATPSLISLSTLAIAELVESVMAASRAAAAGGGAGVAPDSAVDSAVCVAGLLAVAPSACLPPGMQRPVWRLADYQLGACLHRGNAVVYTAKCRLSGQTVVLKVGRVLRAAWCRVCLHERRAPPADASPSPCPPSHVWSGFTQSYDMSRLPEYVKLQAFREVRSH